MSDTLEKQLTEFIGSENDRIWLKDETGEIYVRKSHRIILKERYSTLEIANIQIQKEGQRVFSRFMAFAHNVNPYEVTFIENVMSDKLHHLLYVWNWPQMRIDYVLNPISYYKHVSRGVFE